MKEDHGLPSLVPAKRLYFSSLLETNYRENIFLTMSLMWTCLQTNGLMPQMKTYFHARSVGKIDVRSGKKKKTDLLH